MPQSFVKIWIHVIFSTKHRAPLIEPHLEREIYIHMRENLCASGCEVMASNGMEDHVHLLFKLPSSKSVANVVMNAKGETSHWFNQQYQPNYALYWQDGYAAFSVSESLLPKVKDYIDNQKTIHKNRSLNEELRIIQKKFGG